MNKTAVIFHGLGGSEHSFWIPWLKIELQAQGFDVWTPTLSACERFEDLDQWVQEVAAAAPHREFDVMVGHSAGVPLILRLLSRNDFFARQAIGVAGFIKPLAEAAFEDLSYPAGFDVDAIRNNCPALTFIHSDNDPWDCGQEQGEWMRRRLGGTLVVMTGEGHFGSEAMRQPYRTFPLLKLLCLQRTDYAGD